MSIDPAAVSVSPSESGQTASPKASLETLDLLAQRRSAKPFMLAAPAPTAGQLDRILELASRTPDHGKLHPWRFIVFEGEARMRAGTALEAVMKKNGDVSEETLKATRKSLTHAPLVVAVVSTAKPHVKIPEWEQVLAVGAVSYAVLLAAHAFGFGGVWLTGWPAYDAEARAALGLAPDERLAGLIHLGTQTDTQPERVRPDMASLVTRY